MQSAPSEARTGLRSESGPINFLIEALQNEHFWRPEARNQSDRHDLERIDKSKRFFFRKSRVARPSGFSWLLLFRRIVQGMTIDMFCARVQHGSTDRNRQPDFRRGTRRAKQRRQNTSVISSISLLVCWFSSISSLVIFRGFLLFVPCAWSEHLLSPSEAWCRLGCSVDPCFALTCQL